jgi:type 1 glutamine amidotransferase
MTTTRRRFLQAAAASSLAALGSTRRARAGGESQRKKRALVILGDAYHCVAPLYGALVSNLKRSGYAPVTIIDYSVPFDDFGSYDLIVLSRYAYDDVTFFRERDARPARKGRAFWLTAEEEQKFEDYVKGGGRLFLHHDGIGFYPKDRAISRLAKAFFIKHPPIVEIEVSPTGTMPEMTEGVTPFKVADEEYQVEMDESRTSVFLESHSPQHGRAPQGWAHTYDEGKVAVLIPGHSHDVLMHPMVRRSIQNVVDWLGA